MSGFFRTGRAGESPIITSVPLSRGITDPGVGELVKKGGWKCGAGAVILSLALEMVEGNEEDPWAGPLAGSDLT